jgi:hypothetical protein
MPVTTTLNEQVIEAVISGPDTANRLYTCTGQAELNMQAQASAQPVPETWTFLVGPQLQLPQRFIRATASVSVAGYEVSSGPQAGGAFDPNMPNIPSSHSLDIKSVEADWDDDSGKTELRVEVAIGTGSGGFFKLAKIGFTATVLAEV